MNIKSILSNHLSPKQMKTIKWTVMQLRFAKSLLKKKYGIRRENKSYIDKIKTYSLPGKHVFFGYYDLQQFDKNEKRLLVHVVDEKKCDPAKNEAELMYIDCKTGEFVPIASTRAWSWQQGSRLRWHPIKKDTVLFNGMENDHYVTVEWNLQTGREEKRYPVPFYDVTPDFKYGLSVNFSRLQRLRPGYGYSCIEDTTTGVSVPKGEGIVRYNIETGESILLISLKELAKKTQIKEEVEHYINHISVSPSGKKFIFFHIWTSIHTARWDMKLYVADIETGELVCLEDKFVVSHYCWKNDKKLIVTTAAMNGNDPQYIEYDLEKGVSSVKNGEWLNRDGHPSYIHQSDYYISDTYPVSCMQYVFMERGEIGTELLRVYADPRLFDDMRCDLHPRLTPDNRFITVDTTYKNRVRQVVVMRMKPNWSEYNTESQEHFLVIGLGNKNNAIKEMFYEIIDGQIENAAYKEPFVFPNRIIAIIHRVVFSRKFRKYFRWVPKSFWEKYHVLNSTEIQDGVTNYVIMTYGTDLERLHYHKLIKKMKAEYGDSICFVLMLFDPLSSPLNNQGWDKIFDVMKDFDCVATFDAEDAKKYHLIHFTDPYAKRRVKPDEQQTDIFFVGADKGRGQLLHDIAQKISAEDVDADFRVVGLEKSMQTKGLSVQTDYMTYDETLSHVVSANCLLEVLCEGQNSSSLRYYESVVYNKKLLTNNPNIVNMPFYNPETMKYFERVEEIDGAWVKERKTIDYQYNGEFSIKAFFKKLIEWNQSR